MHGQPDSGHAPVNGVSMYWESRGSGGVPLIVVHGGYGVTGMFGEMLDRLADKRQVIAIELQGHGHTPDTGRPFGFAEFGDDIAGLIEHLGLGQADLLGYSLGGSASLRCAIQHQPLVRRLALISIPFRRDGWYPEVRAAFGQMSRSTLSGPLRQSPVYAAYAAVAPEPGAFDTLIDKTGDLLRQPYDWGDEVRDLALPVQLIYGDADSIPPAHIAEFYALLGGGQRDGGLDGSLPTPNRLAILPGITHYNILGARHLPELINEFLS
jgi:pimeloyl-ACP methyl ester carboxylesterase